jgi:hypothetical protein
MNRGGCAVAFARIEVGHITDGLHVGHAIEKDVVWASRPRLGTFPSGPEKNRVSFVRLSSRTFSLGGVGEGG